MSAVMQKFHSLLQIKSIHTTPYHSMMNGSCERFNGTLKLMLKKIANREPHNWDRYLCPLLFAYREVPQASTGFSPFELLFGYEVRGPLFLIKDNFLDNASDEQISVVQHVIKIRDQIKELVDMANNNEVGAKRKQKLYYDKNSRKRKLHPGDKVLILLPTSSNKLLAEWKGPYEVVQKLNSVDYSVKIRDKVKSYHINMLKPYVVRGAVKETNSSVNIVNYVQQAEEIAFDSELLEESAIPIKNNENKYQEFNVGNFISDEDRVKLIELLNSFTNIFSEIPGCTNLIKYQIKVDKNVKPIYRTAYQIPFHLRDQVQQELDKMLQNGIIQKSNSGGLFQ
jgi:hypothetical protein